MSSFGPDNIETTTVHLLPISESCSPSVQLRLTHAEAQELLNRVLSSKEEDTEVMTDVILKIADAIRMASKAEASESYPAARAA